ncbi:MAG TPA: hypothetical protein VMU60_02155 [Syntrophobacteria bacterium]|nr:hypothetical protein [Syntrophobacteria bacterium]
MLRLERPWRRVLDAVRAPELSLIQGGTTSPSGPTREPQPRFFPRAGPAQPHRKKGPVPEWISILAERGDETAGAGSPNYNKAFFLEELRRRRIMTTFALLMAKVAEDLTGWPIPGDDEWSVPDLMARHLDRRPLTQCRRSREKERVVVVIDTSGSCLHQARFFSSIATAAVAAGDVELYEAPNAGIRARKSRRGWRPVEHRGWHFCRRTVIFFGDFDGGDAVIRASRRNKLYWFCSETRYPDIRVHPWCSLSLRSFRGRFFRCTAEEDFIRLLRKVR